MLGLIDGGYVQTRAGEGHHKERREEKRRREARRGHYEKNKMKEGSSSARRGIEHKVIINPCSTSSSNLLVCLFVCLFIYL